MICDMTKVFHILAECLSISERMAMLFLMDSVVHLLYLQYGSLTWKGTLRALLISNISESFNEIILKGPPY